jgi:predicted small metal-binding protein
MKTMTCSQMAGPCDHAMTAATSDDMIKQGMEHMEAAHPTMAADIKMMPQDDPKMVAWYEKFMKDYNSAPENA